MTRDLDTVAAPTSTPPVRRTGWRRITLVAAIAATAVVVGVAGMSAILLVQTVLGWFGPG